jgi:hypothetical protein
MLKDISCSGSRERSLGIVLRRAGTALEQLVALWTKGRHRPKLVEHARGGRAGRPGRDRRDTAGAPTPRVRHAVKSHIRRKPSQLNPRLARAREVAERLAPW